MLFADFAEHFNWGTAYVASEWIIRVVMLVVVPMRRAPDATRAWLLLVLFLPWIGLALYLLIGQPTYPRWRVERFAKLPEAFATARRRLDRHLGKFTPKLAEPHASAAALVRNLGNHRVTDSNTIALLGDYDEAIDRLVADIDAAQHHVHLLFYIFADDATGMKVVHALARAVQRGVKARVLVDFMGSRKWWGSLSEKLTAAGVEVQRALAVGVLRRKSARADLRNHRKIAVIDGRIAYTGSQNIADAEFKKGVVFQDLTVRATGPIVLELQAVFAADWYMETEELLDGPELYPAPEATGSAVAQVLASGPDYPSANLPEIVLTLLYSARKRIVITTPYFIPDKPLLVALDTAVHRGVKVDLIVSQKTDEPLVKFAQESYYEELLESGIRVHRYRGRFLHAKHLSVDDDVVVIGSSNMDIRSFVLNAEVSLLLFDRAATTRLGKYQQEYFDKSSLLTVEQWQKRSLWSKVLQNFARLMGPLL